MKANTVLSFFLCGLAQIFTASGIRIQNTGTDIRLVVALAGLLLLCEYISGWNLGIDEIIYNGTVNAIGTSHPGRMAPNGL
ncbi:MAG: hypothetical protein V1904_04020 [Bacteroidota bacterium]